MKPVDLIVAVDLHDLAQRLSVLSTQGPLAPLYRKALEDEALLAENAARSLLIAIALHAHLPHVLRALAAAGAPSSLDEIGARLRAVRDARTEAAREAAS